MDENQQQDKNQINQQAVEQHVKAIMGPPPQGDNSTGLNQPSSHAPVANAAPQPLPQSAPPAPPQTVSGDEVPPERVLVIPSSAVPPAGLEPEPVSEPAPTATPAPPPAQNPPDQASPSELPAAGATIEPTTPAASDVTVVDPDEPPPKDQIKDDFHPKGGKIRRFLASWWHNRTKRRLTIAAAIALVVAIVCLPPSRYFILNNLGVRSSASLTVLDNSTQLPLKNVEVDLAGQTAKTDVNGNVKLAHLKLGRTHLVIQKRAFASVDKTLTIGWGSNALGNFTVQPTGSQYVIYTKDWLTGKTIAGSSASGGGGDANSDLNGKILITLDTTSAQQDSVIITVHASGYRDEPFNLDLSSKNDNTVNMVISHKDVFVTNRSGKYDLYSVDIDGKNQKLVLAGSGLEKPDIVLVQHPTDNQAALVSSRVNAHNSDGFLLDTLTLVNLEDNTTTAIAQAEQVQIIGWAGSKLLFVQIAAGASAADPQRFKLISYDYKTADKKTLASANSFNDILLDGNIIYYAPSGAYQKDPTGLVQVSADGSNQKTLLKNEVWNIFRVSFDSLNLATEKDTYSYTLGSSSEPTKLSTETTNSKNRLYITSPDGKHSLWVDQRDGKGLLISYNIDKNTDTTLRTQDGLVYPVKWLSNEVVIYRVKNDQETADYVININGGNAHKVIDLYGASGIDRWYYY